TAFARQTPFAARLSHWRSPMNADWGSAVVVDPRTLSALDEDNRRLRVRTRRLAWGFGIAMGMVLLSAGRLYSAAGRLDDVEHGLKECRRSATRSSGALAALAHSHEQVLAATEQAPSVGTRSWGRRFTVTKYTPMSPAYGRFNHGITATLTKADPQARIIAVDPKLIPCGSRASAGSTPRTAARRSRDSGWTSSPPTSRRRWSSGSRTGSRSWSRRRRSRTERGVKKRGAPAGAPR